MLLVQLFLFFLSVQTIGGALIRTTRTAQSNASITPPPQLPSRYISRGKRDETVSVRGPGTCGFLSMRALFGVSCNFSCNCVQKIWQIMLTLHAADEKGSPPLTCPGSDLQCTTSKLGDLGDGIKPPTRVGCCPKTASGQDCIVPTSCIEIAVLSSYVGAATPDTSVLTWYVFLGSWHRP